MHHGSFVQRKIPISEKKMEWLTFPFKMYLLIWLHRVLVVAHKIFSCYIWDLVPPPGVEPGSPRHWEHGVLVSGPPEKSLE